MKEKTSYFLISVSIIGASFLWLFDREVKTSTLERGPSSHVIKKYGHLKKEELKKGLYRYENNEVICYESKIGLSCSWKKKKNHEKK